MLWSRFYKSMFPGVQNEQSMTRISKARNFLVFLKLNINIKPQGCYLQSNLIKL